MARVPLHQNRRANSCRPSARSAPIACSPKQRSIRSQAKVSAHQAAGMHLELGLLAILRPRLEEVLAAHVIREDASSGCAPAHSGGLTSATPFVRQVSVNPFGWTLRPPPPGQSTGAGAGRRGGGRQPRKRGSGR